MRYNPCRHRYVLDLFSGSGGVGRAAIREGADARFFDVQNGPDGDLLDPHLPR